MAKKKYVFKLVIAGAGGVGKTTLLTRAVTGKFIQNTQMTIGVEFHLLNFMIGPEDRDDSLQCTLQLWDFGGQERFRFMLDSYVAGARGALLLYDLTRLRTLDGLEEWVNIVRKHDPNLPILFLGTKLDRVEDITVSDDYAKEFLDPLKMFGLMKVSSKDGTGVRAAFKAITRKILELNGIQTPADPDDVDMAKITFAKSVKPFAISQAPVGGHPSKPLEIKPTFPAHPSTPTTSSNIPFAVKPSPPTTYGNQPSPKPVSQAPFTQRPFTSSTTSSQTHTVPSHGSVKTTTPFTPRPFTSPTIPTSSTPGSIQPIPPKTTTPLTPRPYLSPTPPTSATSTPSTPTPTLSTTASPSSHRPYIPPTTPTSNIAETIPPIPPKTTTSFTPRPYQSPTPPMSTTLAPNIITPSHSTAPASVTPRPYIPPTTPSQKTSTPPSSFASRPPPITPGAKPQPFTPRPFIPFSSSKPQEKEKESIQPPVVDLKPWEKKTDKPTKKDEPPNTP